MNGITYQRQIRTAAEKDGGRRLTWKDGTTVDETQDENGHSRFKLAQI